MRQLKRSLQHFASSTKGNFGIITALTAVPLALAVGLAVDFSSAVNQKSSMQNALDSATLSLFSMPTNSTKDERGAKLQKFYTAAGGSGTTKLHFFEVSSVGAADVQTSANAQSPTGFMNLANISAVDVGVNANAHKAESLVEATFGIEKVSGHWGKTVTLYGLRYGATLHEPLLRIEYQYNRFGDPKGYGTTTAIEIKKNGGSTTETVKQKRKCDTYTQSSPSSLKTLNPAFIYSDTNGVVITKIADKNKIKYRTECTNSVDGKAVIDVSLMQDIYLEMKVPAKSNDHPSNPNQQTVKKSNETDTSKYLYIDGNYNPTGKTIDIFSVVPCDGVTASRQAWEDGGSAPGAGKVAEADFFYNVTGRCDFNRRPDQISMTK